MIDNRTSKFFRGIAIMMVIGSHYAAAMFVEPIRPLAKAFISTWGVYGVDIFFLLSGYGLVKSAQKKGINKEFVLKRFFNSYVPYILIVGFFDIFVDKNVTDWSAACNLLIGMGYWFMSVIFAMYIMFMIIYKIGRFKEVLITAAVIGYTYWLYSIKRADFWELSNGAFLIGVYAATFDCYVSNRHKEAALEETESDKSNNVARRKTCILSLILLVISACIMLLAGRKYNETLDMWAHMVTSMSFTFVVLAICILVKPIGEYIKQMLNGLSKISSDDRKKVLLRRANPLNWIVIIVSVLGKYSLYIYLLHIRLFWKFVLYNTEWPYMKSSVRAALLTLGICIPLGFAFEWNLNRILNIVNKKETNDI